MKQKITLVVAKDKNNAIGVDNKMAWHVPEDSSFFKKYTMDKPVIMGRKTWESLPKKPLCGRHNLVITRNEHYEAEGAEVFLSIQDALNAYREAPEICVIGGEKIYQQSLELATHLVVTEINLKVSNANRFFPAISECKWRLTSSQLKISRQGIDFSLKYYDRVCFE